MATLSQILQIYWPFSILPSEGGRNIATHLSTFFEDDESLHYFGPLKALTIGINQNTSHFAHFLIFHGNGDSCACLYTRINID